LIHKFEDGLESETISKKLNDWIDLMFGYKSRGIEAVYAYNTFNPSTYPENYQNPDKKSQNFLQNHASSLQIQQFGQCPIQLFKEPHPTRKIKIMLFIQPSNQLYKSLSLYFIFTRSGSDMKNEIMAKISASSQEVCIHFFIQI
jgi:hypothetical protein